MVGAGTQHPRHTGRRSPLPAPSALNRTSQGFRGHLLAQAHIGELWCRGGDVEPPETRPIGRAHALHPQGDATRGRQSRLPVVGEVAAMRPTARLNLLLTDGISVAATT